MKTFLITGGAGFIGSHLCKSLHKDGYNIICLDSLITGQENNIKELMYKPYFKFIKMDVCDRSILGTKVNYVFHLASPASPIDYQQHPLSTMLANFNGTHTMLDLAHENNARFLFTSTSEVYGNPERHPQHENYWGNVNPNGVRSCYDESKRCGEALTMIYYRNLGVDTRIARIFNTYGPLMRRDDGRAIPNLITHALMNEPLPVYGDGSQTRSFCYVSDMIDGLKRLMFTDNIGGEVVNLGNPDEYSILELAKLIKKITKSKSSIQHKELPEDDPVRRMPDISWARRLLKWSPKVGLDEGIALTIENFK